MHRQTQGPTTRISKAVRQARKITKTTIGSSRLQQFFRPQTECSSARISNLPEPAIPDLNTPKVNDSWYYTQSYNINR